MADPTPLLSIASDQRQRIEKVQASSLSALIPKTYSTVKARVLIVKSKQKEDELGKRNYIFGICEDSTFRVPFICYKPYPYFFHDAVFEFKDGYVHEFDEKSILIILTERSSINYLVNDDPQKYVWHPQIGGIKRAMGTCRVTLQGVLSQVSESSGLVRRCESCGRVTFDGRCPNGHKDKLFWSVRIAGRLADQTGSIPVVFPQHLTCRLLGRTIGEILQMTEGPPSVSNGYLPETLTFQIPEGLEIREAYADDPDEFRSARTPIVVDLNDSRITYLDNIRPNETFGAKSKQINPSKPEDRRDLVRLAEKLIEIKISNLTGSQKINGIMLVEDPIPLYRTENAKVHVGFRLKVNVLDDRLLAIEAFPTAEVYESVADYVNWRRQRGASANAIKNSILNYRRNIVFAPRGELACIVNLHSKKAKDFVIPAYDLTLPDFWKKIHGMEISPEETPLVIAKSYRLDLELTFPPSCVFFDKQTLRVSYGTRFFIERKQHQARQRAREVLAEALKDFSIGDFQFPPLTGEKPRLDARQLLLNDIREKLVGRTVKATGSVIQANRSLYFIPRTVDGVF